MKVKDYCLILLIFTFLLTTLTSAEQSQIATIQVQSENLTYTNGDHLFITGRGFVANDQVKAVSFIVLDADYQIIQNKFPTDYSLSIDANGRLSGSALITGLPAEASHLEVNVFASYSNVKGSPFVRVVGSSIPELQEPPALLLAAGTALITDDGSGGGSGNSNGFAETSEDLDLSGSGWTGSTGLLGLAQREYSNIAASTFIQSTTVSSANASLAAGSISGYTTVPASFDASTVTVRVRVVDDAFQVADSDSMLIPDSDPPDISTAVATSLNTIQITFDEAVAEDGDATGRFSLAGDGSGLSVSSMTASGSEPTSVWNLTLDGNLSDRDPDGVVVTYTANAGSNSLEDPAGNEVTNLSNATASDMIDPATPTLTSPSSTTIMDGASIIFTATADAAATDASMVSVALQGSNNGSSWTTLETDTDTGDAVYSATYTFGTKYSYYRVIATDDAGNQTVSSATSLLTDAYRVEITAFPAAQDAGIRGQFTIEIQNNYSDAVTFPSNLFNNLTTDQGTGTFYDAASGGSAITSVIINSADSDTVFWYSDTDDGTTPTITVTEAASNLDDNSDSQQITINASDANHFRITTANSQAETAGTDFDITVTARKADSSVATGYTGSMSLNWSTTATASPDGTSPSIPSDASYTFSSGSLTISNGGTLYDASETPTITVTDGSVTTTSQQGAGAGITVSTSSHAETRIKTADESSDGDYGNNIFTTSTLQGATQASPDASISLFGVRYDAFGNLLSDASGSWGLTGDLSSAGVLTSASAVDNTFTASIASGSTHSGTITVDNGQSDATGTINIDDDDGETVTSFNITTNDGDSTFVIATWSGSSSGDNGGTGTPTSYEIRWTPDTNGPIDTEGEWDSAISVGTGGQPAFSVGTWSIDMSNGNTDYKYFAIRTFDGVGNVSSIGSGSYTTSSDISLPVTFNTFSAQPDYDKVIISWKTTSEINNEGFFLYRAEAEEGPFLQTLNQQIVPGLGNSSSGSSYEFVDENIEFGVTYYYKLISQDFDGTIHTHNTIASVKVVPPPKEFEIAQNYPNPFNPSTQFKFSIAKATTASLEIYNLLGQKVNTIFENRYFEPGVYSEFNWDAKNQNGRTVAAGIYLMVFTTEQDQFRRVQKMVYTR
ncbi:MAG: T9SS type A sorting domain-containing protein [Calditrichia bacterium]